MSAEPRHGCEKLLCIGMLRAREEADNAALLHDPAVLHDDHAIGHLGDYAHVVGDHHDRSVELALQFAHQLEDLSLNLDIERGCRFIRDQHLGTAG